MTWTKTPDDYPDRLLELSDAAYRLHHAATTFANRVGLDGRIPKARLSLIPVPQRTRRPAIVRELVASDLWADDGNAWTLTDFFDAQPSAEEVAKQRQYDAARQRKRFATSNETRALRDAEVASARTALFDARERRRARTSQRETHRESQRPAPIRPVPLRYNESEDEVGDTDTGLGEAGSMPPECPVCGLLPNALGPSHVRRWDGRLREVHDACLPVKEAAI